MCTTSALFVTLSSVSTVGRHFEYRKFRFAYRWLAHCDTASLTNPTPQTKKGQKEDFRVHEVS